MKINQLKKTKNKKQKNPNNNNNKKQNKTKKNPKKLKRIYYGIIRSAGSTEVFASREKKMMGAVTHFLALSDTSTLVRTLLSKHVCIQYCAKKAK